jgi:hypothetical protein
MGLLKDADKEKVKRAIPKVSNKIVDATVARLYIAHPDPASWTYTGLSGALALVNDLVGNTFFLKLVDISVRTCTNLVLFCAVSACDLYHPEWGSKLTPGKSRCYLGPGAVH